MALADPNDGELAWRTILFPQATGTFSTPTKTLVGAIGPRRQHRAHQPGDRRPGRPHRPSCACLRALPAASAVAPAGSAGPQTPFFLLVALPSPPQISSPAAMACLASKREFHQLSACRRRLVAPPSFQPPGLSNLAFRGAGILNSPSSSSIPCRAGGGVHLSTAPPRVGALLADSTPWPPGRAGQS